MHYARVLVCSPKGVCVCMVCMSSSSSHWLVSQHPFKHTSCITLPRKHSKQLHPTSLVKVRLPGVMRGKPPATSWVLDPPDRSLIQEASFPSEFPDVSLSRFSSHCPVYFCDLLLVQSLGGLSPSSPVCSLPSGVTVACSPPSPSNTLRRLRTESEHLSLPLSQQPSPRWPPHGVGWGRACL